MNNIISKNTTMQDAKTLLDAYCIATPFGWEIVIGMLLSDCDYLRVEGYGSSAVFVKCFD